MEEEELSLTFWGHLEELRSLLIKTAVTIALTSLISFYYSDSLLALLTEAIPPGEPLVILSPQEGFTSLFTLSFWTGVLLSAPFWLFIALRFILPALKGSTAKLTTTFSLLSLLFVSAGIFFALKITLPLANNYLYTFNEALGKNLWTLSLYLDYVWLLLFAHGIAFEAGAVLLTLIHFGILSPNTLKTKRRQALVSSLILGALLTPPDVLTQIAIAIPLYGFYELAILYGTITSQGRISSHVCHDRQDTASTPRQENQIPPKSP